MLQNRPAGRDATSAPEWISVPPELAAAIQAAGERVGGMFLQGRPQVPRELREIAGRITGEVDRCGWAVVEGLSGEPESTLLGLASLAGTVGVPIDEVDAGPLIMDIRAERPAGPDVEVSSRSATPFDLHTDLSYVETPPDLITVLCLQPDDNGQGLTLIADVWDALPHLSAQEVEELSTPQFTFAVPPRCRGGVLDAVPVLGRDPRENPTVRIRFDKVTVPSGAARDALLHLYEALQANRTEFLLGRHCAYVLDNRRVVHGRSGIGYRGDGRDRHLKRVYGMRAGEVPVHAPRS
ncbi:MAG TPA: TauD/TfdA family dioxygenase [Longimicrobium sp.]